MNKVLSFIGVVVVVLGLAYLLNQSGAILSNNIDSEAAAYRVKSFFKPSLGRSIQTHYKTYPNKSILDNYSTKGNYNPHTGKFGTKSYFGW